MTWWPKPQHPAFALHGPPQARPSLTILRCATLHPPTSKRLTLLYFLLCSQPCTAHTAGAAVVSPGAGAAGGCGRWPSWSHSSRPDGTATRLPCCPGRLELTQRTNSPSTLIRLPPPPGAVVAPEPDPAPSPDAGEAAAVFGDGSSLARERPVCARSNRLIVWSCPSSQRLPQPGGTGRLACSSWSFCSVWRFRRRAISSRFSCRSASVKTTCFFSADVDSAIRQPCPNESSQQRRCAVRDRTDR